MARLLLRIVAGRGAFAVSLGLSIAVAGSGVAAAATICVDASGKAGCYKTIGAGVTAAAAGDTVHVAPGTYHEDVVIGKPLSLEGSGPEHTTIDAAGMPNGIDIDGLANPGLADVVVKGFMVENADFEGIVVTNASSVTITETHLHDNDRKLDPAHESCPGIPDWETLEGFDCGEGIHLSGVSASIVTQNVVEHNAGGILLSDDTGATHDNLVSDNRVSDNPYDCGITLASHPPAAVTGATDPFGVFRNTIAGNESSRNGLAIDGAGAGVGLFASVPGTKTYANVVIANRLTRNGLPGVAMHGHAPRQVLDDNQIVGNVISGNHADTEDAATPGPTGINVYTVSPAKGTLIAENTISSEDVDIAISNPAAVEVHLNDLHDGGTAGLDNIGGGSIDATLNWWGCPGGPGEKGCSTVMPANGAKIAPWLTKPFVFKFQLGDEH